VRLSNRERESHLPRGIGRAGLLIVLLLAVTVAAACGGGGNKDAEKVLQRFMELGQNPGATAEVMIDKLPPGLPADLPEYPGASLVGSTVTVDAGTKSLSVLRETSDTLDNVLLFFEDKLDQPPWQILLSTSQENFAALQFSSVSDPNLMGGLAIQSSDDGKHCTILLSVQTAGLETPTPKPFEAGAGKPLPKGFPSEMPVYPSITITDTAWARSADTTDFEVDFLTKGSPQDVIDFYRSQLKSRGWTVTDEPSQPTQTGQAGALNLSYEGKMADQPTQTWSGGVSAVLFNEDPTYTQARLQLRIGPEPSPTPSAPTP
jgi:hypothetical protein